MSIYEKLYDWQKEIVNKNIKRHRFGLFLDMGLGKTPISLAFAEQHNCDKIIVITINAKTLETENDSGSWLYWLSKSNINYNVKDKRSTEFNPDIPEMLLINYEGLFSRSKNKRVKIELKDILKNFIKSCKGKNVAVILDESHKIKNLKSLQTGAIFNLTALLESVSKELYVYLLTGTPFTSGYEDFYAQLKLLGYENTKTGFIDTYCVRGNIPGLLGWQQPIVGYKNVDNLYKLVHQFAITIKSDDVISLPEKFFVEHTTFYSKDFEMFTKEKVNGIDLVEYASSRKIQLPEKYNVDKKVNNPFYSNIDYPNLNWLAETSGSFWLRARQLSIGFNGNAENSKWYDTTRLNDLKAFLENNPDNYLLFYNYTPELLAIYEICEKLNYNIDVYCGEIKSLVYYNKYASQSSEEKLSNTKNIILANYSSGSTGLNWQEYNKCILFSIPLYKDFEQGIKRIHRTGQNANKVIYHIFMQNNWLDKGMREALDKKVDYSNKMFEKELLESNQ